MSKVETYISRQSDRQQSVLLWLHGYLTSFPSVSATIRYGIPFYDQTTWVCYLSALKNSHVSLSFVRGYELSNEQGVLKSKGRKQILSAEFESLESIPKQAIKEIINEALILDETLPYKPRGRYIGDGKTL